mmetsp:Transcript_7481/g.27474  ORF Transcript_7481/g.27474 Transcript_7481/m.27474 type:complete len:471 (+) Transcript_7481:144-1556(+)
MAWSFGAQGRNHQQGGGQGSRTRSNNNNNNNNNRYNNNNSNNYNSRYGGNSNSFSALASSDNRSYNSYNPGRRGAGYNNNHSSSNRGGHPQGKSAPLTYDDVRVDLKTDAPVWTLSCYGSQRGGECDIVGDVSPEEARWQAYNLQAQAPHLSQQYMTDCNRDVQIRLQEYQELLKRARNNIRQSLKLPPSQVGALSVQQWGQGISNAASVGATSSTTIGTSGGVGGRGTGNAGFGFGMGPNNSPFGSKASNPPRPFGTGTNPSSVGFGNSGGNTVGFGGPKRDPVQATTGAPGGAPGGFGFGLKKQSDNSSPFGPGANSGSATQFGSAINTSFSSPFGGGNRGNSAAFGGSGSSPFGTAQTTNTFGGGSSSPFGGRAGGPVGFGPSQGSNSSPFGHGNGASSPFGVNTSSASDTLTMNGRESGLGESNGTTLLGLAKHPAGQVDPDSPWGSESFQRGEIPEEPPPKEVCA